jgi:hypothetical protein
MQKLKPHQHLTLVLGVSVLPKTAFWSDLGQQGIGMVLVKIAKIPKRAIGLL